jgi:hypothetical protein
MAVQGGRCVDGSKLVKNAVRIRVCYEVSDKKEICDLFMVANQLLDAASSLLTYKYTLLTYSFVVKIHAFISNILVCICRCPQKCFERLSEDVTREIFCKFYYVAFKEYLLRNLQAFVHVNPSQRKLLKSGDDVNNRRITSQNIRNGICSNAGLCV